MEFVVCILFICIAAMMFMIMAVGSGLLILLQLITVGLIYMFRALWIVSGAVGIVVVVLLIIAFFSLVF